MHVFIYLSLICFLKISMEKADYHGKLECLVLPMLGTSWTLLLEPMLIYIMDGEVAFPCRSECLNT